VRLLFAKGVATYIRERVWHRSQELRKRSDGSLELRLETSGRKELARWILSWMPHVEVLAPGELRDRVRERMRQGLARCETSFSVSTAPRAFFRRAQAREGRQGLPRWPRHVR
jgi:hypothetical protein